MFDIFNDEKIQSEFNKNGFVVDLLSKEIVASILGLYSNFKDDFEKIDTRKELEKLYGDMDPEWALGDGFTFSEFVEINNCDDNGKIISLSIYKSLGKGIYEDSTRGDLIETIPYSLPILTEEHFKNSLRNENLITSRFASLRWAR